MSAKYLSTSSTTNFYVENAAKKFVEKSCHCQGLIGLHFTTQFFLWHLFVTSMSSKAMLCEHHHFKMWEGNSCQLSISINVNGFALSSDKTFRLFTITANIRRKYSCSTFSLKNVHTARYRTHRFYIFFHKNFPARKGDFSVHQTLHHFTSCSKAKRRYRYQVPLASKTIGNRHFDTYSKTYQR